MFFACFGSFFTVKSYPYPKAPHHSCHELHQRSSLPDDFEYIVCELVIKVLFVTPQERGTNAAFRD